MCRTASVWLFWFVYFLLIELHQPCDTGCLVGLFDRHAVCLHDGSVIVHMSLAELWRYKSWIVQISQARIRIKRAGIKDSLCSFCYTLLFLFCWLWPWEIIVHRSLVSEIRLYSTTDHSNPSHMNIRCQNTKFIEPQIRNNSTCITGYYFRLYESKWDISPCLWRMPWNHQICGLGLAYLAKQISGTSFLLP